MVRESRLGTDTGIQTGTGMEAGERELEESMSVGGSGLIRRRLIGGRGGDMGRARWVDVLGKELALGQVLA